MNIHRDYLADVIVQTGSDACRMKFDDVIAIPQLSKHYDALRAEAAKQGYTLKFVSDEPYAMEFPTMWVLREPCAFYRVEEKLD